MIQIITITILYILSLPFIIPFKAVNKSYTLYEITTFNARERSALYSLHVREGYMYFLNGITNEAALPMDVVVKNNYVKKFERRLRASDIQYTYIPYEINSPKPLREDYDEEDDEPDVSNQFYSYEEMNKWIEKKIKEHSPGILEKRNIAITEEKRNMFTLRLSTGKKKRAVFIIGGEQGRDWTSPAIILNFVNHLLEDKSLRILTDYYDFYFVPVFNPDGYEWSMQTDRFWSKNRKAFFPEKVCPGERIARGVNIERNWYLSPSVSVTSQSECNGVYVGHKSFSEVESDAVRNILNRVATRLMAFINLRAFEKLITIPFAHTFANCNNHDLLMEMLSSVTETLNKKHNTTYFFGQTARFLYNLSGNCADWVKINLNVPVVYTLYMQYDDSFLVDTSHIRPLTSQLMTILNETLFLAKDVYGPIFDKETRIYSNVANVSASIIVALLLHTLLLS